MYPPITYKLLESKKACADQLTLVKEHFGLEPIPLTESTIENFSETFDIEWAARNLLSDEDYAEYEIKEFDYETEWSSAKLSNLEGYLSDNALDKNEHDKLYHKLQKEFTHICTLARADYDSCMIRLQSERTNYNQVEYEKQVLLYQDTHDKTCELALKGFNEAKMLGWIDYVKSTTRNQVKRKSANVLATTYYAISTTREFIRLYKAGMTKPIKENI